VLVGVAVVPHLHAAEGGRHGATRGGIERGSELEIRLPFRRGVRRTQDRPEVHGDGGAGGAHGRVGEGHGRGGREARGRGCGPHAEPDAGAGRDRGGVLKLSPEGQVGRVQVATGTHEGLGVHGGCTGRDRRRPAVARAGVGRACYVVGRLVGGTGSSLLDADGGVATRRAGAGVHLVVQHVEGVGALGERDL